MGSLICFGDMHRNIICCFINFKKVNNYKNKEIKRDPKWCPRCYHPMVSKDNRKCLKCGGRLLWWGDDLQLHFDGYEDFYIWYKSIFNFEGWYHSSYFNTFRQENKSNVK